MPYMQGCDLYSLFENNVKLDSTVIVFFAAQIILAIGYLHKRNIVHRDMKLENILVDKQGYIKVIDYGLSKKLKPNTICEELSGTFMYMAPEMINKKGHNMSVDWWALGIILYELKYAITPFAAKCKHE